MRSHPVHPGPGGRELQSHSRVQEAILFFLGSNMRKNRAPEGGTGPLPWSLGSRGKHPIPNYRIEAILGHPSGNHASPWGKGKENLGAELRDIGCFTQTRLSRVSGPRAGCLDES